MMIPDFNERLSVLNFQIRSSSRYPTWPLRLLNLEIIVDWHRTVILVVGKIVESGRVTLQKRYFWHPVG
jgi:hypothetical protein